MKHISELLILRRQQLERARQISLFEAPREKGSNEWRAFQESVRADTASGYVVRVPYRPLVRVRPRSVPFPHAPYRAMREV